VLRRFPDTHVIDTPAADTITHALSRLEQHGMSVRRNHFVSHQYSRLINRRLEILKPDAVIAIAAAHKVAYIDPKWPLVYAADAMYATVMDYYHNRYSRVPRWVRAQGDVVQRALLERVDRVLLCSGWAADAARQTYDIPSEQLRVVPMGANLDEDPPYEAPALDGPLRLLFVGYDWYRKGGDVALEVWRELRRRTGDAELDIVGAAPDVAKGLAGVRLHGKLNKSNTRDYEHLAALYRGASFFIMPSRQEAFGIVYCEASAYGRPSVAAATGAVPSVIESGRSGLVLPLDAPPSQYADRILETWQDRKRFVHLCEGARQAFETRLSWRSWGEATARAIREVVPDK
jgi:glycosyltransferase involved in cell wall biosynthesis